MVEASKIRKIAYSTIATDFFHFGHLRALKFAQNQADFHVCSILTDESIITPDERKAVIENLKCVDRVILQESRDSTENLKKIHKEFPNSEIILVRSEDYNYFPESDYLNSINGKIIKHPNYDQFSDLNLITTLLDKYKGKFQNLGEFTNFFKLRNFKKSEIKQSIISTKAETLKNLKPLLKNSKIEEIYSFTVLDWKNNKGRILENVQNTFNPSKVVVRSSAITEDTTKSSMAGYFHSELNISSENKREIENAIIKVIESYSNKKSRNSKDQILIQKQTENIIMSGVLFTRSLENNAPYYVINYDNKTTSTDTVTKGQENKTIKISKFADPKNIPELFKKLITSVNEIESLIPDLTLDIEFAINDNKEIIIFQVRPVTVNLEKDIRLDEEVKNKIDQLKQNFHTLSSKPDHLFGYENHFADMPDWNPAEIIGDSPNHLAYSLYSFIITDSIWHEARSYQGYRKVSPAKLLVLFGNKPYINVRNDFNSFIPDSLSDSLSEKLVNFYLKKLKNNPELQDKVEFDILYTCYDLTFDERIKELKNHFSYNEIKELREELIKLTNNLLNKDLIEKDLSSIKSMRSVREQVKEIELKSDLTPQELIQQAKRLLESCKEGTLHFSRIARLAFISKIILKSLLNRNLIDQQFYDSFLNSINTIAKQLTKDFHKLTQKKLTKEKFLKNYGHLRPGTYDITNLRYDSNPSLFSNLKSSQYKEPSFKIPQEIHNKISSELNSHNLNINSELLFEFIKKSLEARELSKFEFSRNLSEALELIAKAGEKISLSRKDLAFLALENLFRLIDVENLEEIQKSFLKLIETRKKEREINRKLILPPVILSEKDIDVVSEFTAKPNFITNKKIYADLVDLNKIKKEEIPDLKGKIVLLENGDPGYDWIFTKNPAGLITKYGGVASHMSIRCAEFGLPAAIGCGNLYDNIKNSSSIVLDCEGNKITNLKGV
ncbi:MAG: PEP/pyruvate-binding domain-containing protein [Nanoarchaeota archaeon]